MVKSEKVGSGQSLVGWDLLVVPAQRVECAVPVEPADELQGDGSRTARQLHPGGSVVHPRLPRVDEGDQPGVVGVAFAVQPAVVAHQARVDRVVEVPSPGRVKHLADADDGLGDHRRLGDAGRLHLPRGGVDKIGTPPVGPGVVTAGPGEDDMRDHAVGPLAP